jgi:hypothetical protein
VTVSDLCRLFDLQTTTCIARPRGVHRRLCTAVTPKKRGGFPKLASLGAEAQATHVAWHATCWSRTIPVWTLIVCSKNRSLCAALPTGSRVGAAHCCCSLARLDGLRRARSPQSRRYPCCIAVSRGIGRSVRTASPRPTTPRVPSAESEACTCANQFDLRCRSPSGATWEPSAGKARSARRDHKGDDDRDLWIRPAHLRRVHPDDTQGLGTRP